MTGSERYGRLDRLLHRFALRLPVAQRTLAEVEERLYAGRLESVEPGRPVFVTALPRSGTTILLRLLWKTGAFASTLYRDMPFVMCPLLWGRFSGRFSDEAAPMERHHGDGLLIAAGSPEGFEEVLWKQFWPGHYTEDRILPWTDGASHPEFDRFFATHMRKVVALRSESDPGRTRYLSKNNVNVARLAAPPAALREGLVLVPVREPLQHAASLLAQHERFCALHDEDPFLLEYMTSIGHHEFGRDLRPIDLGGWLSAPHEEPGDLAFWLRYWIATYGHLLSEAASRAVFVSYDRLATEPGPALERLAGEVGVDAGILTARSAGVHPPRTHAVRVEGIPPTLVEEAEELYRTLEARSVV